MTRERKETGEARDYAAYLLRLWRERRGGTTQWRASLQDPHSGERAGFANLEELFAYLRRETGDLPQKNGSTLGNDRRGA
jgi:hypothetical protein